MCVRVCVCVLGVGAGFKDHVHLTRLILRKQEVPVSVSCVDIIGKTSLSVMFILELLYCLLCSAVPSPLQGCWQSGEDH